ncbi:NADPH-dependent FMN reductase [Actinomadura logoneensis]|uniref:NADPH-dependent FMN reductase n=1 Tax=Actinomadura logoneensis TaxID=2293572 RepID=A0A372JE38_9ACTN|nr:FMN reductase [Actinomadura logoneensis]RFU38076.1 NADPH-dependent FMN reductase [Actinomadura logoneensis]
MSTRSLAVVSAGLREPSSTRMLADRLARATAEALREQGDEAVVEVVELRTLGHDLVNNLVSGFPAGELKGAVETVTGADGLIAVTPVFQASYSGLFKTFFDVLDKDALENTPTLLGATGGTPRHSLAIDFAMRPLFAYLRAAVQPTAVYAATEDWGSGELVDRLTRAGRELAGTIAGRAPAARPDPFEEPVPFERLLSRE